MDLEELQVLDPDSGKPILQFRPRRNKTRRPIVLCDPWQSLDTPLLSARHEAPFASFQAEDIELAHGTFYNTLPELDHIASQQRLFLPNRPIARPERQIPVQPTPKQLPRLGSCSDLFTSYSFDPATDGEWVRARLIKCKGSRRSRKAKWELTPDQIVSEIEVWYESWAKDATAAAKWFKDGKHGRFRPNTKLWVIPQQAMKSWAMNTVWHTAAWFAASPAARASIQITPHDWSVPAPNPWQTDKLWEWAKESGLEDLATMQDLHDVGIFLPFTGTWDSVLTPPAAGFYEKLDVGQETTYKEISEGKLSEPLMGPFTIPFKLSGRNVARICRGGVIKDRRAPPFPFPLPPNPIMGCSND